jgi:alkylated DNA repair protein alkB family protein 1
MPDYWKNITKAIAVSIEKFTNYPSSKWDAQGGIINYYSLKDSLTAHQDRSELNESAPLFSFSFGNSAVFLMGSKSLETEPTPILLESGDVIILSGESRRNFHSLPRVIGNTCQLKFRQDELNDYMSETRINVNIRQVHNYQEKRQI